jgi:hypothetical protein
MLGFFFGCLNSWPEMLALTLAYLHIEHCMKVRKCLTAELKKNCVEVRSDVSTRNDSPRNRFFKVLSFDDDVFPCDPRSGHRVGLCANIVLIDRCQLFGFR